MEDILFFIVVTAMVVVTQALVFFIRNRTNQIGLALLPNLGLLGIGLILSIIGYVVAMGEPGSWADLGFIILLMVTFITTGISTLISLILIFVIKIPQPKPTPLQSQPKKKAKK
jgi:hypothetical protein